MSIKLTYRYRMPVGTLDHNAVLGHLRDVLNVFASKPDCTRFYIGITGDLKARLRQHERERPEYTLMCAIHKEESHLITDSFQRLEAAAITRFQGGVYNPTTGRVLRCGNAVGGGRPQNWLYLLVDPHDVAGIPVHSTDPALWGDEGG
jgi:hypothetical protein